MCSWYGRIHYIFSDVYNKAIDEVSYHDGLTEADIRTAIKNSSGYRPSLFVPEVSRNHLPWFLPQ